MGGKHGIVLPTLPIQTGSFEGVFHRFIFGLLGPTLEIYKVPLNLWVMSEIRMQPLERWVLVVLIKFHHI